MTTAETVGSRPARSAHPGRRAADARSGGEGAARLLDGLDTFARRHLGPDAGEVRSMLSTLGYETLEEFIDAAVPDAIRERRELALPAPRTESETLALLREIASENEIYRSCIGMGYHGTITPPVILRNILENPQWYTQYTPYQAEISQGRLEALLNFQTMVADLTGLPLANASLLDEGTAAAEAMSMSVNIASDKPRRFFVASDCHPQTIEVVRTRADSLGIELLVGNAQDFDPEREAVAGILLQYPTTHGYIADDRDLIGRAKRTGAVVAVAADLLALTLLTPPGELGADICVGTAQRFGVPMGYGGPHAGFMSTHEEHARKMPGRIIGVSRDSHGNPALRLAIQTREQHIKRDRATSNICTAQVLLAIMSGMYAVYHGPEGLRRIATRVHALTLALKSGLEGMGVEVPVNRPVFDTLRVRPAHAQRVVEACRSRRINVRDFGDGTLGITLDETADRRLIVDLLSAFSEAENGGTDRYTEDEIDGLLSDQPAEYPEPFARKSAYLTHPVFNQHHSETEMLRYITKLQRRDLSLADSMIPLGSCTMKLNATTEMIPITWPEFGGLHPFAPAEQARGYRRLFRELESWLATITGFAAVSLQPNAGSQGEYAGLMTIRAYHRSRGEGHRDVCLIPESAHGTNPASAVIAGMRVVGVKNLPNGAIDFADLRKKAEAHADRLAALMVTYPSTCGVFESNIKDVCALVHEHGGQVYMDGANMNAQVGLTSPGFLGADVCHLNLHKTFCIPHGGGGPGMGPIGVAEHLAPFLPGHIESPSSAGEAAWVRVGGERAVGPISAAPYGSASILLISYAYIAMMGAEGLTRATALAVLNANYMAKRLEGHYGVLFAGENGRCAHEFVIDCRPFDKSAGIKIDDIAKRLIDYGFHAPTMSWPVPGTLMIEPTESESKAELDRFCDALIQIREEIAKIERGEWGREDNPLKHAPHTIAAVSSDSWPHAYGREVAAYPAPWLREHKFWASVGRVDNPYGDRNLLCTCPPVGEVESVVGPE